MHWMTRLLSAPARATLALRWFGWRNIPLILYVRPTVREISAQRIVVRLPLRRRNANHWGAMYFGALNIGADCALGLLAMQLIAARGARISLIFKDSHARFHRRALGDVDFICEQGDAIAQLVAQAAAGEARVELPVQVIARVPDLESEPVATFTLTLSLKGTSGNSLMRDEG